MNNKKQGQGLCRITPSLIPFHQNPSDLWLIRAGHGSGVYRKARLAEKRIDQRHLLFIGYRRRRLSAFHVVLRDRLICGQFYGILRYLHRITCLPFFRFDYISTPLPGGLLLQRSGTLFMNAAVYWLHIYKLPVDEY